MAEQGLSAAFVAAMDAIAAHIPERPLPPGLNQVEAGDWKLAVNASREPVAFEGAELSPYTINASHKVYIVICLLDPSGGIIGGGMTEDEFIAEMKKLAVPA